MGYVEEVSCDVCGKVKGATNHWFLASINTPSIVILPLRIEWAKDSYKRVVICGQGCLSKWISENAPKLHEVIMRPVGEALGTAACIHSDAFNNYCACSKCIAARSDASEQTRVSPTKISDMLGMWCNDCQSEVPEIEWDAHCNGHKMEREADLTRAYREEQNGPF